MPMQLDHVRPLHLAQIRPSAPLVDPEQRLQRIERVAVDVKRIGQKLPDRRSSASLVHRLGIPGAEEQTIRLPTGPIVALSSRAI
jgi:hypothetical protein